MQGNVWILPPSPLARSLVVLILSYLSSLAIVLGVIKSLEVNFRQPKLVRVCHAWWVSLYTDCPFTFRWAGALGATVTRPITSECVRIIGRSREV